MYRCSSDLHNDKFAEIASSECTGSYVSGGVLCSELEAHLLSVIICVIDGEVCVVDFVMIYLSCDPSKTMICIANRQIR